MYIPIDTLVASTAILLFDKTLVPPDPVLVTEYTQKDTRNGVRVSFLEAADQVRRLVGGTLTTQSAKLPGHK